MTEPDNEDRFPRSTVADAPDGPETATRNHTLARTGASEVLVMLTGFFVILLLIVIFILQNQTSATINFLWMHGSIPLALAILLSVIFGALLIALAAGVRVLQLRHTAARHRREENYTNPINPA